jgi:hypothetical protein
MTTPTAIQGIFSSAVAGTPAMRATGTNAAEGVSASSDTGAGVSGTSGSGPAVVGASQTGDGGRFLSGDAGNGVAGLNLGGGIGVQGSSVSGIAVGGASQTGDGGKFTSAGGGTGVSGSSVSGDGVAGHSQTGNAGVFTTNGPATAVLGTAGPNCNATAVHGINTGAGTGVYGESVSGNAVAGHSQTGNAGSFDGNVQVNGTLTIRAVDVAETITQLTNRIAALEQQVAKLNTHYHIYGPATFYAPDSSESVSMYSVKEYILSALNSNLPGGSDIAAGNFDNQLVELRSETGKTVQADVEVTSPPQFGTPGPNTVGP